MAYSRSFTNDEIKHRVLNVYAKFVTDVEPDRLSDWLVQENVISVDEMLRIRNANHTAPDRCRAFLSHLFTIQHPRAFLVVREALRERNHHLLEHIDNPGVQLQTEIVVNEETEQLLRATNDLTTKNQELATELERERTASKKPKGELRKQSDEIEELQRKNKTSESEIRYLVANVKALEKRLFSTEETEQQLLLPRPTTNDLTTKIKELAIELERERLEAKALRGQLRKQSDEIEILQEKNKASESEIIHLVVKVKDLEQSLYPTGNVGNYVEKPYLTHTMYAGSQGRGPINGMTILGKELFVSHENNSLIEVYDSKMFQLERNWAIEGMSHPIDIASCNIATCKCIYTISQEDSDSESCIMKLVPNGKLINKWPTGGERGRLSTYESNVIVCLLEKQVINEFSGDGELLHTVSLSPSVGFSNPFHAIKVTSSHFAVCHGYANDELHRVCIVDTQGNIIKELRKWESKLIDGKLNVPICLVEGTERSILVADRDNQKIRLLDSFLKLQRNLVKQELGLDGYPVRICLDETKTQLYVAANYLDRSRKKWKDGSILIFNIR